MVFSSLLFLFGFLPIFFALHTATPRRYRNLVILAGSYFFYAWGAPKFVFVLFGTTVLDYVIGRLVYRAQDDKRKRFLVACSVCINLALLFYFKYANFFIGELNELLQSAGVGPLAWTEVALPIGISFFTFHKLSYVVDVYRGTVAPADSFWTFALYIVLFPQLVAGPIIRYHDIADQLHHRTYGYEVVWTGIVRFVSGLAKKVLVADPLGLVADKVFALPGGELTTAASWLGIVCYSFQIYFDFSGYSDMAIGLGQMMGFRFPENFNKPYISQNITEFWRRWHISLSSWMREYLYIPLGGNRISAARTYINLWIVFVLSGLWHGASWNFLIWGVFHGFFLVADKLGWLRVSERLPVLVNVALTYLVVLIGWVFFRAETLPQALDYLSAMWGMGEEAAPMMWSELINNRAATMLIVAFVLSFGPALSPALRRLREGITLERLNPAVQFSFALLAGGLSVIALANSNFHPFIYFRF